MAYPALPGYKPRPIYGQGYPSGLQRPQNEADMQKIVQELIKQYAKDESTTAAGSTGSSGAAGGAVLGGGGIYAASQMGGFAPTASPMAAEFAAPEMTLPELTPMLPSGELAGSELAAESAGVGTAGAEGASSYAAATGGPGALAYWAGPAAFLASAPIWSKPVMKYGEKAGTKLFEGLGLKKKRFQREYDPNIAKNSSVINRQIGNFSSMPDNQKMMVLDKFKKAGAIQTPGSSTPDFNASESTPDNATRIGIRGGQLTEREKSILESKYGKHFSYGAIPPEDLAKILSPIGRNDKGVQRLNDFNEAVKMAQGYTGQVK